MSGDINLRRLSTAELDAVCDELCRVADNGDPKHRKLRSDVERAYFVALNSVVFRCAVTAGREVRMSSENARDEDEDSLASNYLADDCAVRCGLCGERVNPDGLCDDCDSGEIERQRYGDDFDAGEDFDA